MAQTVPAGYVGWKEIKSYKQEGKIYPYRYCYACAAKHSEKNCEKSSDVKLMKLYSEMKEYEGMDRNELISVIFNLKRDVDHYSSELQRTKNKYSELKTTSDRMRGFIAQARAMTLPDDD
jgi:hypothetical protein